VTAVRTTLRPGDIGAISALHGTVYAKEYGFDTTFEAYVAGPLAAFVLKASPRERIWIAERDARIVGCVAIVEESPGVAQLRWFLVAPEARGAGLGGRLLDQAVAFSRTAGYERIILWTVSTLDTAARLYRRAGFERVEAIPAVRWGVEVVEEKYAMTLGSSHGRRD
jgi:N-acetylglutamate synthase-like GNAT family acetyltransferase